MAAEQLELESTATTTFQLNYDCLFEVFERLSLEESMNLAEAYEEMQVVADRIYRRKFNKFTFDFKEPIDRVLYHAGPSIKSLTLILNKFNVKESDLIKIVDTCKELKCLTLNGFNRKTVESNPFGNVMGHLEMLTLNHCSIAKDAEFFGTSENLKSLNLFRCSDIEKIAMKECFENNRGIKSFTCDSQLIFYPQLLQLIPNVERLSLRYHSKHMKLNSLSKLQSLRHLTLLCWDENVNDILTELAKINILEELVLIDVAVDANTFKLIKSFENLQLLAVTTHNFELPPTSDALPAKLRTLKLGGFQIVDNNILSLAEQLQHLQDVHLQDCELESNGYLISDFDDMTDLIVEELIEHADRQLNIILTSFLDNRPEVNHKNKLRHKRFVNTFFYRQLWQLDTFPSAITRKIRIYSKYFILVWTINVKSFCVIIS